MSLFRSLRGDSPGRSMGGLGDMLVAQTGLILRSFKLRRREPDDRPKIKTIDYKTQTKHRKK